MLEKRDCPDSVNDLAQIVLEAVSVEGTDEDSTYIKKARAIADAAAAAFHFAAAELCADDWQTAYAQALFLHNTDLPTADFKIIYGDDILIPGQVETTFATIDEWYNHLERTVMPARAQALLRLFGDEIKPETRDHWESLVTNNK